MCAVTTWPFFSFTRKVGLGRVSTTSPSIWIASSLDIMPLSYRGRALEQKGRRSAICIPFSPSTQRGGLQRDPFLEERLELCPGNAACAQAGEVPGGELAVDHRHA